MKPRQSREKLLKAAVKVFSTKGYASASVSDIIEEAAVARGTFYLYFESKRNAFEQVLAHVIEQIEDLGHGPNERNDFPSPAHLYHRIYSSYENFLKVFKKNRDFARLVFTEATGLDKGFDKQLEAHYENHRKNIRHFLKGVQNSGLARTFDIDIMCEVIIGFTERCARVFALDKQNGISIEKLTKELADLEFAAISNIPLDNNILK